MFPFHFLDRLGEHDVTCTVSGGGRAAQAGAIRLATARALCSFVTEDEVEWMRQGASSGRGAGGRGTLESASDSVLCRARERWLLFYYRNL